MSRHYPKRENNYESKVLYSFDEDDKNSSYEIIDYSDRAFAVRFSGNTKGKQDHADILSLDGTKNDRLRLGGETFTGYIFRKGDKAAIKYFSEQIDITQEELEKELKVDNAFTKPKAPSPSRIEGIPTTELKKVEPTVEEALMILLNALRSSSIDEDYVLKKTLESTQTEMVVGVVGENSEVERMTKSFNEKYASEGNEKGFTLSLRILSRPLNK